jgi:hypothetical protein
VRPRADRLRRTRLDGISDDRREEPAEAIVYCPECGEREFGVNLLDAGD